MDDYTKLLWDLLEEIDAQIYLADELGEDFADRVEHALWGPHDETT